VVRKVILPHTLPGLLDAMRVNMAATWNLVVVAELIAAQSGLGYRITRAQRFLQTDKIFAVLIVIGVIGVSIDVGFRLLRNGLSPWAR
jgi:NitT/TauT family transport system permease protein